MLEERRRRTLRLTVEAERVQNITVVGSKAGAQFSGISGVFDAQQR